jgi:hypothetical protein
LQTRAASRIVERGHARVGSVDRQQVLDQVVGADAEEVDLGRQEIGGRSSGRHLEVEPDRGVLAELRPFPS